MEPTAILRTAISDAVDELEAVHRPDATDRPLCVTCGARDGSWPCVSRMVADDLRGANDSSGEDT